MPTCTFPFRVVADGSAYSVQLTIGAESVSAPFEFDVSPDSRVGRVVAEIAAGRAQYADLLDIGSLLYSGLIHGRVADLFERTLAASAAANAAPAGIPSEPACFVFRLALPQGLHHLPWECLYDEPRSGFVFTDPRYSLVREVSAIKSTPRAAPPRLPVSMLAVIPQGSGLSVDHEWHALKLAVERLGEGIDLQRLEGRVTPDRLRECVDSRQWDIVHFIGHGDIVNDVAQVRLNSDNPQNDVWMPGETFATFFSRNVPSLIVLNSCLGGSQSPLRSLGGIPPYLRRVGVPAVVAMQFEIPDEVAIKFAETFYGELLTRAARGRVDLAVAEARRALFQNAGQVPHSFAMPVLYRHDDHETLFDIPASPAPPAILAPSIVAAPLPTAPMSIPDDLVSAFREQRCIPIIGPEVLRIGAMRSSPPPPGPRELARMLAEESGYPEMEEFAVPAHRTEAASLDPLPSVCQHYERGGRERFKLIKAVQRAYANAEPPSALCGIAAWDVPGVICAYFDGLLEEAMTRQHRTYRSIVRVDKRIPGYRGERLLVHLRGVFKNESSLVLTERDHEKLWDDMRKASPEVTDLTRKSLGISLLYLGVSPRDPLVRRLTQALRADDVGTQGPMFFAAPARTSVDEAYWERYDVQWLDVGIEALIAALSGLASEARP